MKKIEFKKILVPVDFTETSDIAMAETISLANRLKAQISLLHVIEYNSYRYSVARELETRLPSIEELETSVRGRMDEIVSEIERESQIKPVVNIVSGNVPAEIINFSRKHKIDLIVMGTHGASGYREMFIGSNAQRLVTLSEIPVLTLLNKINQSGFKNILLPIDNSLHSREKVSLAMQIAELFNAKIHVLGLPDSEDKTELDKFQIKLKSVERIISEDKLPYSTSVVHGKSLAKAAIDYADKNRCDLIVINTGHESEITGIFLGAFHQQIVNHSKIPVLSMKHTPDHYSVDTPGFGI
jgi:nucleotide-binding universal stress UspA family protein